MQSKIDQVLELLQTELLKAAQLQNKYHSEILFLQSILNRTVKSAPVVHEKQVNFVVKQKPIQNFSIENKLDELLSQIETQKVMIQNHEKPKFQVKLPEIVIEKKPPLPVVKKSTKISKVFTPTYVPPRNSNSVTGKVTQETVVSSTQKVFRPQKSASIKKTKESEQKKIQQKNQLISSKKIFKQEPLQKIQQNPKTKINKIEQPPKSLSKQHKTEIQKCQTYAQFASFNKPFQQTIDQLQGRGNTKKKNILKKIIDQCQNVEKGHRQSEQKSRYDFIKHACNYIVSKNNVSQTVTVKLTRKQWQHQPNIFELDSLLDRLQNELQNIKLLQDYRLQPKQQYRIFQSAKTYTAIVNKIMQQSQSQVPDQLQLTFSYNKIKEPSIQEGEDSQQINETQINETLIQLLQQLTGCESLQKKQLRGLQVLAEVGMFRSRKSPLLVMRKQFNNWKQYYSKIQ